MPNHFSALKRLAQTKKRTAVNRRNKGLLRSSVREIRQALVPGKAETASGLMPKALSSIDKAVQKGIIHKNTAGRLKSRLMARWNAIGQAKPQ